MPESKLAYKNYMLVLLTVIAAFNYLDRYVLSLVLEPIKQEFQLSDSELGFMTGIAFALFYAIAGVPHGPLVRPRQPKCRYYYNHGTMECHGGALWPGGQLYPTVVGARGGCGGRSGLPATGAILDCGLFQSG